MRVLLCKIQCPSIFCFCKPSPHIYAASSLKLEDTPTQVSSPIRAVDDEDRDHDHVNDAHVEEEEDVDHVDGLLKEVSEEDCAVEEKEEGEEEEGDSSGEFLKSSLKKAVSDLGDGEIREKKKVQWVDLMGKDLAEIREFESSEEEDIRYNGDQSCVCVIL